MNSLDLKNKRSKRRSFRVREKLKAVSSNRLRISVFKSNKHFYAQLINDQSGSTLLSVSSLALKASNKKGLEIAKELGLEFGKKMLASKIDSDAFLDRGSFLYHGKIAAFAEGVRENGIKF